MFPTRAGNILSVKFYNLVPSTFWIYRVQGVVEDCKGNRVPFSMDRTNSLDFMTEVKVNLPNGYLISMRAWAEYAPGVIGFFRRINGNIIYADANILLADVPDPVLLRNLVRTYLQQFAPASWPGSQNMLPSDGPGAVWNEEFDNTIPPSPTFSLTLPDTMPYLYRIDYWTIRVTTAAGGLAREISMEIMNADVPILPYAEWHSFATLAGGTTTWSYFGPQRPATTTWNQPGEILESGHPFIFHRGLTIEVSLHNGAAGDTIDYVNWTGRMWLDLTLPY